MVMLSAGVVGALLSVALDWRDAATSAARTWPPFVLVAGLLLLGAVANEDGVFSAAGDLLDRLPGGEVALYFAAMGFVALVSVVLNLDTAAAFLTPVVLYVAEKRQAGQARLLYGCLFMANSASLLLPGSNLTNLLVLADRRIRAPAFLGRMLAPWLAAVVVTSIVVLLIFRHSPGPASGAPGPARAVRRSQPPLLTLVAIGLAAAAILVVPDAALPVAALGLALAAVRAAQRRVTPRRVAASVDGAVIGGLFLVAMSLGTLARAWSYPATVMRSAGAVEAAVVGAVTSVAINNLPAAVLLGSRAPAHPIPLLFGLDIGPNLLLSGSLSALVWWRAAKTSGVTPSPRRYSAAGAVLVPLTLAATLGAYALFR